MNYNEITNTCTSIQCRLLLYMYVHMYIDSTRYTILYNNNTGMYNEPRHELDYTGITVIVELKMEFRSCARGRQWCGIIHYY